VRSGARPVQADGVEFLFKQWEACGQRRAGGNLCDREGASSEAGPAVIFHRRGISRCMVAFRTMRGANKPTSNKSS